MADRNQTKKQEYLEARKKALSTFDIEVKLMNGVVFNFREVSNTYWTKLLNDCGVEAVFMSVGRGPGGIAVGGNKAKQMTNEIADNSEKIVQRMLDEIADPDDVGDLTAKDIDPEDRIEIVERYGISLNIATNLSDEVIKKFRENGILPKLDDVIGTADDTESTS